jgi:hypothetical protein
VLVAVPPPTIAIGHSRAGIELRMTEAEVRSRLGSPVRIAGKMLGFGFLTVQLRAGRVVRLTTTSRRFRTPQGYGVGTRVSQLQQLPGIFCDLEPGGGTCYTKGIEFDFARQRVTRVTVR